MFFRVNRIVAPGDSLIYYDTLELKGESINLNIVRLQWTIPPLIYNNTTNGNKGDVYEGYDADRIDNNRDTVTIFFRKESSSINELNNQELLLFPNPFEHELNFQSSVEKIDIFNNYGELICSKRNTSKKMNYGFLAMGQYMCVLNLSSGELLYVKLIKLE